MTSPSIQYSAFSQSVVLIQIHTRVTKTFYTGATLPLSYRRTQLLQLARLIQQNTQAIESAIHEDLRKPKLEIGLADTGFVLNSTLLAVERLQDWATPHKPQIEEEWRSGFDATIYKVPKGPSLVIS